MNRGIIYPGQVPLETDLLYAQQQGMVGLSKLAAALLGTSTVVNGLGVTQTTVASMNVQVAAGEIYQLANLEATAYSSLAADTTHQLLKQGVNLDTTLLALTAPGTVGFSVNYLIQATFTEADGTPVVLPYYNASNPSTAYSGPAGAGTSQSTRRLSTVTLSAKAGTAATTGTQVTPAPDSGYVGLAVVTVAYGASTVVNANISAYSAAPLLSQAVLSGQFTGSNQSLGVNGYQKLPGGLILQWGEVTLTGTFNINNWVVNFPISFPNACYNVQGVVHDISGGTLTYAFVGQSRGTSSFAITLNGSGTTSGVVIPWLAIGK